MIHALRAIYKDHGVIGLWRGSSAAVARVSVGSAAQLCTFSSSKEMVVDLQVGDPPALVPTFTTTTLKLWDKVAMLKIKHSPGAHSGAPTGT